MSIDTRYPTRQEAHGGDGSEGFHELDRMHHVQLLFTEFPTMRKCWWAHRCGVRVSLASRDHVEGPGRCSACVQIHEAISGVLRSLHRLKQRNRMRWASGQTPKQLVRQVPLMDLRPDRGTKGRGSCPVGRSTCRAMAVKGGKLSLRE